MARHKQKSNAKNLVEDEAMERAIKEGLKTGRTTRNEVFRVLRRKNSRHCSGTRFGPG
jgi:hypothetical protein